MLVEDIEKDNRIGKANNLRYNTKSLLCVPLTVSEKVIGVLNLNNKEGGLPFDIKDLHLSTAIASRISYILEKLYELSVKEKDVKVIIKGMDALLTAEEKNRKHNADRG